MKSAGNRPLDAGRAGVIVEGRPGQPAGAVAPDLRTLRAALVAFGGGAAPPSADENRYVLVRLDLSVPEGRRQLLGWLNAWGCRIRYPRPGEVDLFDAGIRDWANRSCPALGLIAASLAMLTDEDIELAGERFHDLMNLPVGQPARPRTLGSTAASKLLHRLYPRSLMPWDEAIALQLHGGRDADAYVAHQQLGRDWARRILADSGCDEQVLAVTLGVPGRPVAKMLDDYCYVRFTRSVQL